MTGGIPINTIELGQGPPLVFVHGLLGSWTNWVEQLPVFAAEHRVIAMDLPGFGHSPMPPEQISISGYARVLERLLDALDVDAAAVVGNSMGGFVSAELAIAFPQRVERLALVSPAGVIVSSRPYSTRGSKLRRAAIVLSSGAAWASANAELVARRQRLRKTALGNLVRHPGLLPPALASELIRGAAAPGFFDALDANLSYDLRERLAEIVCPTLIVWGENDRIIPVRDADTFEQLIPQARKVVLRDTGHLGMLERPATFNALLREFLDEQPAGPGATGPNVGVEEK
jgi:pimeloyl-ACP methyl ester carboxylesterase